MDTRASNDLTLVKTTSAISRLKKMRRPRLCTPQSGVSTHSDNTFGVPRIERKKKSETMNSTCACVRVKRGGVDPLFVGALTRNQEILALGITHNSSPSSNFLADEHQVFEQPMSF